MVEWTSEKKEYYIAPSSGRNVCGICGYDIWLTLTYRAHQSHPPKFKLIFSLSFELLHSSSTLGQGRAGKVGMGSLT